MCKKLTEEELKKAHDELIRDIDNAIDKVLSSNQQTKNAGREALERIKQMPEDYGVTDKNIVCDHFLLYCRELTNGIKSLICILKTMTSLDDKEILLTVNGLGVGRNMGQFMAYLEKEEKASAPLQRLLGKLKYTRQQYYVLLEELSRKITESKVDPKDFFPTV